MSVFEWRWVNRYFDTPNSPDEYSRSGDIEPRQCRWWMETRITIGDDTHIRARRCSLPFNHKGGHR